MVEILTQLFAFLTGYIADSIKEFRDFLFIIFKSTINFFGLIWDFIKTGSYEFAVWCFKYFIELATLSYLKFLNWALPFAWDIAKGILADLGYFNLAASAWGSIDSEILALATVLRLPEAVTILITAALTKYVMRFIPFV